jgi:hypothetical protein
MPAAPRRAACTLNGQSVKIKAGTAKFTPGGLSGTPVVSDDNTVDTSYEPKECMFEFTLIMTPGHNMNELRSLQDAVGTWTWLDTGESWALTGVTANEGGTWSWDGEGMPCKFHANPAQPA